MAGQPENEVKNAILWWFALQGRRGRAFAWQVRSTGIWDSRLGAYRRDHSRFAVRGQPDITALWIDSKGVTRPVFVECKSARGVVSEDQKAFLERANQFPGVVTIVARSLSDVTRVLEGL